MIKRFLNNKGLTLIELLVVITFISIISIFLTSITVRSLEITDEVRIESAFRDEADVIVSSFIKALYQTNSAHIAEKVENDKESYLKIVRNPEACPNNSGKWDISNEQDCDVRLLGFKTDDSDPSNKVTYLYLMDVKDEGISRKHIPYQVLNKNISIHEDSKIKGSPDSNHIYEIQLVLEYTCKRGGKDVKQRMTFINTNQPF